MDIKAAAALIESEYRARAARAEEAYRRALATHPALYEAASPTTKRHDSGRA